MGIRGLSQKLLRNYLENREQNVRINKMESDINIMEYGIPQGTVIGLLLFILYINDLYNTKCKIFSFADDTAIIFEAKNWDQLSSIIASEMPIIQDWFCNNSLTVNVDKICIIMFSQQANKMPSISKVNNIH